MEPTVVVYGASGHTGRFVVEELQRRGLSPVLAGRSAERLAALAAELPEAAAVRVADVDEPGELDAALLGADAVINCAGPFASTSGPVIEAALRAGVAYLDVAAEIEANLDTFAHYDETAKEHGLVVVPAMAFYGGLGDLLATAAAAAGDWTEVDEVTIAYGLSSWAPTAGTLASGRVSRERRDGRRIVYAGGRLEHRTDGAPVAEWEFPPPLGRQPVVGEFTMADTVTIARHLHPTEITSYMAKVAVDDLTNPETGPPDRESEQTFLVDVVVRRGDQRRRAVAEGRDIYGITAPLVVEGTERVLAGQVVRTGALTAGEAFAAGDFLESLSKSGLLVRVEGVR